MNVTNAATVTLLNDPFLKNYGVEVFVKREDLVHPIVGGNKFRKLKYNLVKAKAENKTTLVTFGGAYSNHIAATAFAGKKEGFNTIGIIRGENIQPLNITLQRAAEDGMQLFFVERELYRDKELALTTVTRNMDKETLYIIPEGGSNAEGFEGCTEIVNDLQIDFDYICCPCGTGITLAGIAASLKEEQSAIGFSVMKNNFSLDESVKELVAERSGKHNFQVVHDYHFGGYAKSTLELKEFTEAFIIQNNIQIEPIYTGKLFFGVYEFVKKGVFRKGQKVVVVHTGGLQYLG